MQAYPKWKGFQYLRTDNKYQYQCVLRSLMELNVMLVESWEHFPLEYGLYAEASNSIERSNVSLQQY